jgi:hypothetical protein
MNINPCRLIASLVAVAFTTIVGAQNSELQDSGNRLPITIHVPAGRRRIR